MDTRDYKDLIELSFEKDYSITEFLLSTARIKLSDDEFFDLFRAVVKDGDKKCISRYLSFAANKDFDMWHKVVSYLKQELPERYDGLLALSPPKNKGLFSNSKYIGYWLTEDHYTKKSKNGKHWLINSALSAERLQKIRLLELEKGREFEFDHLYLGQVLFGLANSLTVNRSTQTPVEVDLWVDGYVKNVVMERFVGEKKAELLAKEIEILGNSIADTISAVDEKSLKSYMDLVFRVVDMADSVLLTKFSFLRGVLNKLSWSGNEAMKTAWLDRIKERSVNRIECFEARLNLEQALDVGDLGVEMRDWWERYKLLSVVSVENKPRNNKDVL